MRLATAGADNLIVSWFQFTHPGGVRLSTEEHLRVVEHVSIHAPGRGATHYGVDVPRGRGVSIHAPGRGATLLLLLHSIV